MSELSQSSSKPAKKPKSIHEGHRSRMKNRFLEQGLDSFETHEILEMLLYYAIPQGDTNPLAHHLLDTFGSISKVLDAPVEALEKVKGVGPSSAVLLKMIPQLARVYLEDLKIPKPLLDAEDMAHYIIPKFVGRMNEVVVLLLLNSKAEVLFCDVINEGSVVEVSIYVREIVHMAMRHDATSAVIAHNHPSGNTFPSRGDMKATADVYDALQPVGVALLDHFIIADGKNYLSMQSSGLLEQALHNY